MHLHPTLDLRWLLALPLLSPLGCGVDSPLDIPGFVALCYDEAGTNCECSGVLIEEDVVLTARHCVPPPRPYVIAGRIDPADPATADPDDVNGGAVALTASRCRDAPAELAGDCIDIVANVDADLLFLEEPIPEESAVPARFSTTADRTPGAEYIVMGRGPGTFRPVELGAPVSCIVDGVEVGTGDPETGNPKLCFVSPPSGPGLPALENGDSGAPLYIETADGELSVAGVFSATQAGLAIFVDMETYRRFAPGTSRPGFYLDFGDLIRWQRQCYWSLPDELVIYPISTRSADFDGDGNDEGFFESEQGVPYIMRLPEETLIETGPLTVAPTYAFANLATPLTPGAPADMLSIGTDSILRVSRLAQTEWTAAPIQELDLSLLDPFWNGADLTNAFELDRFVNDPILRAGDLDGDGNTDVVASLEQNLVVLRGEGQAWTPTSVAFEALGIPNAPEYRESITLADVSPTWPGDELIVRRPCGLAVFGFDTQQGLTELFDQGCDESEWVASDEHGYGLHKRWRIAAGNLNGDACADVIVRADSEVFQLFAACDPQLPVELERGPDTQMFFHGPMAEYAGWSEGLQGSLRLGDIDGDGLDDLTANSPYGAIVHINQNDQQLPFASVGGIDPALQTAARPYLEIDGWGDFVPGRFDGVNREFISYSANLECFERWWLFDL